MTPRWRRGPWAGALSSTFGLGRYRFARSGEVLAAPSLLIEAPRPGTRPSASAIGFACRVRYFTRPVLEGRSDEGPVPSRAAPRARRPRLQPARLCPPGGPDDRGGIAPLLQRAGPGPGPFGLPGHAPGRR